MKRRDFIKYSASIFGGTCLSTGNITASYAQDIKEDEKAVLFIFLGGGATHIETFNPIPFAPVERRSTTGSIKTNVVGMELGGLFKELSKRADKIVIPRAFGHRDQNHASAVHWVVTGEANFGAGTSSNWPSYGSVMSRYYGTNTDSGLPTYVKIGSFDHDDAAWLGGKYTGYDATRQGRKDLRLMGESYAFKKRLQMLDLIDGGFKAKSQQLAKDWSDIRGQAVEIILGDAAKAFRVEKDPAYDSFKDTNFGKDALTAIRLLQAGSKFVTLNLGGWDMHQNIVGSLERRQVELDTYLGKIMDLLEQRGMYERVMLVTTSEFGRTPKVNSNAGRDHFGKLTPLMISCGSYDMGRVIGTTNANADEAEDGRCEPKDLAWTIFDHLGINKATRWTATDGRPHDMIKNDAKNILTEV